MLNVALPWPLVMLPDCPGDRLTDMCEVFVLPVAAMVVSLVALRTERVTDLVSLFAIVRVVGDAVRVH